MFDREWESLLPQFFGTKEVLLNGGYIRASLCNPRRELIFDISPSPLDR